MTITPTYIPLANITLTSSTSSVTFSSIVNSYRDLVVVCNWQNSGGGSATRIQLNNDGGANYSGAWMTGTGSAAQTASEGGQTSSRAAGASVGPANTFSNLMTIQFLDYSATDKNKIYLVRYGSASTESQVTSSRWANNNAITSIRIFDITGQTFQSGSTFALYGIAS